MIRKSTESLRDKKGIEMIGYEAYMEKHPQVARKKADSLREAGGLFLKDGRVVLPRNSNWEDTLVVDARKLDCGCSVYRTKKACPHVAAVIGMIEDNGGIIPVTDGKLHVQECLEQFTRPVRHLSDYQWMYRSFIAQVCPFTENLSLEDKQQFILEVAHVLNDPQLMDIFYSICEKCFREFSWPLGQEKIIVPLYKKRQEYRWAVVAILEKGHSIFTKEQEKTIVQEIAQDDALAVRFLPRLVSEYSSFFSREQLVAYLKSQKTEKLPSFILSDILHRMMEEPPLCEEYLGVIENVKNKNYLDLKYSDIKKLTKAGYGDRMNTIVELLVSQIRHFGDYNGVINCIPPGMFLPAWKKRISKKTSGKNCYWNHVLSEYEIVIDFRENPDADPDQYDLDTLGLDALEAILSAGSGRKKEVCNVLRKHYRAAIKGGNRAAARKALMILARGGDTITSKYVSDETTYERNGDDLVYLTAVGIHYDTLQKIAPELKRMENLHAAGQNE